MAGAMQTSVVVLLMAAVLLPAAVVATSSTAQFEAWQTKFGVKYPTAEETAYRATVFTHNLQSIEAHNARKTVSWTQGVNAFTAMTWEEFRAVYVKNVKQSKDMMAAKPLAGNEDEVVVKLPASWDWRKEGGVTPVENQGQCGSSWAYGVVEALENLWHQKTGKLVELSVQQLNDCTVSYGNDGCYGGFMTPAYEYVMQHGLCAASDYPYKGVDQNCSASLCTPVIPPGWLKGYKNATAGQTLEAAVYTSVVSTAMYIHEPGLQFYTGGVYTGVCDQPADHGIGIVGYGTLNNVNYWTLKNSWGASWGLAGYLLIARTPNMCDISPQAQYPVA